MLSLSTPQVPAHEVAPIVAAGADVNLPVTSGGPRPFTFTEYNTTLSGFTGAHVSAPDASATSFAGFGFATVSARRAQALHQSPASSAMPALRR